MLRRVCVLVLLWGGCSSVEKGGQGLPDAVAVVDAHSVGIASGLDGSGSHDPAGGTLTYAWSILSAPTGSQVSAVAAPTAATTSFVGDRAGTYKVRLTVTASGGAVNAAFVDVNVAEADVFYVRVDSIVGTTTITPHAVRADGSNDHAVGCPVAIPYGTESMDDPEPDNVAMYAATAGSRQLSNGQFVYSGVSRATDGAYSSHLFVTDATGDCTTRPALQLDKTITALAGKAGLELYPRESPDHTRIVFEAEDFATGHVDLVTVALDGTNGRVVTSFTADKTVLVAPSWVDATHVAWIPIANGDTPVPKIATAADSAMAPTSIFLDCTGVFGVVSGFEMLPGNQLLLAAGVTRRADGGSTSIYRESSGSCVTTSPVASSAAGEFAGDMTLSADGTMLLFGWDHGQTSDDVALDDIYRVPVDASHAPTHLAGDATTADYGAHFLPGGAQIAWTRTPPISQGVPSSSAVWVAGADGTSPHAAATIAPVAGEYHVALTSMNTGGACSTAPGSTPSTTFTLLCVGGVVAWLARRRYSSRYL